MHIYREYFLYVFKVLYLISHLPYRQSSNIVDPESKMFLMTDDSFLQKQGSFGYSVPHQKSTIWFQRWSWRDLGCLLWWDYSVTSQHLRLWRRSKLRLLISRLHSVVPELKLTEIVCSIQDWICTDKTNCDNWNQIHIRNLQLHGVYPFLDVRPSGHGSPSPAQYPILHSGVGPRW